MHKLLLFALVFTLLFSSGNTVNAQVDSLHLKTQDSLKAQTDIQNNAGEDDDFNVFLLFVGTAFVCTMIGAAIVGSFAAALAILLITGFISAGIISVSVITGIYKKSIAAGYKALIIIVCMIAGTAIGSAGLFIVTKLAGFHVAGRTALLTGAASGLAGGVLMGLIIYKMCNASISYIKSKFQIG